MYKCIDGRWWLGSLVVSSVVAVIRVDRDVYSRRSEKREGRRGIRVFVRRRREDYVNNNVVTLSYDRTMAGPRLIVTSRVIQSGWIK